jgi:hypothetical protein
VDEDAPHRVGAGDGTPRGEDASPVVGIDLRRLEDLSQHRLVHAAGDEVGVERVDEGVGLGVVSEEHLLGLDRRADPALQQDGSL